MRTGHRWGLASLTPLLKLRWSIVVDFSKQFPQDPAEPRTKHNPPRPKSKPQVMLQDRYPGYTHPEGYENLVSQQGIAKHLGVSQPVISNWIARGHLPQPKIISGHTGLWNRDEISSWHEDRKRGQSKGDV